MQDRKPSYSCEVCFKTFQFRGAYTDHLRTHANTDVRHECSECPCFFKNRGHLKSHIKEVHRSQTRIYKCSQCSRKFDSKPLYTRHRRKEHTQSTPHQCVFCQLVYATKNSLKWHVHINHNKDFKKSKCPYCPSEFKWPHHLRVHIKKSHIEQGFTPTDLLKKGLTSIRRKSNNCIVCEAKLDNKLQLMLHLRDVHKQELDIYKCCRCEAVFNLKTSLRNHIIDHKRRKDGYLHECPQCHPEISPRLFAPEAESETGARAAAARQTEIEREVVDFEITLMEDDDIRCMIRARLKHKRRRRRRAGLLMKTDVEPESIVVEPTILHGVDGDTGDDTGRHIQLCLERVTANTCRLCHRTFSKGDTLCEHMAPTHSTPPVTSNKNNTIATTSDEVAKVKRNLLKDITTPKRIEKDAVTPTTSEKVTSKIIVLEKDVETPKSVDNVEQKSKTGEKDVSTSKCIDDATLINIDNKGTPRKQSISEKDEKTPKSVENVDNVSKADKDVLKSSKKDGKDAKIDQIEKDVTPKKIAKKKTYTCHVCMEKFNMPLQLGRHIRLTHNLVKCKHCKTSFTKTKLNTHKCIKRKNASPKREPKSPKASNVRIADSPKKPTRKPKLEECGKCALFFSTRLELFRHISDVHMHTGKEKDEFSCDTCSAKFPSRDEFSGHMKTCKGDKEI